MHAETLSHVFKPLVELPDRHLLASAVGLTLALITGRTDLCSAGVFGAGKTRAAAAVIVGLIAIDPTLSIMICTKESAAAQAVAEHIVSMHLPDALLAKFGRLIGFHEAQKGASARTAIDVGSQNRNQVLRGKQVIIGCGGGFRHETAQKYSPILEWMAKIQLCLHDEAQQFGNLDEVAALARLPASCICIWTGDHKQTPGGLKKTPEAIAFRHKMMKRPIGLRCGTTLVQPHRLMELLPCIAETSPDTMARSIMTLSVAQARSRPGCINELQSVLHAQVDEEMLLCPVKRAALAVLWASYNVQESGLSVASSLGEAAGLEGRHQWGLILPSSARVSLVTYQTVIAVRYPDLVHIDSGEVSYGMFFSADPGQAGGFLPIVWDVPGTDMEAADAIKVVTGYLREKFEFGTEAADSLTVLHNRTNMVRVFGNSVTVKNSGGETRTRCVTSCAGSTAFLSVVAQTRRGFLSGGSARQTANLNDVERDIQLEEAYARATVALTRARRLCILLCPLDQKGPIGAATILGCLQYGLGYMQHSHLEMPLWEESRMLTAPSDATFMSRLHATSPTSMLPPLSILVMRPSPSRSGYEFVRLHLVVVDVNYHWATRNHGVRYTWPFLKDASPYCTPMSCGGDAGAQSFCNERFAFGYARDNSTYPLFLLHPVREQGDTFSLISVRGGDAFLLNSTPEIRILPLEHFFDAFRAAPMRDLHSEVISAFHLSPDKVTDDLVISRQTATELIRPDVRDLELVDEPPEQGEISPLRQPIRTPRDVRDQDTDVAMSQSSWTSSEDTSAEDSCTDEEHDQELFLEAYTAFTTKSEDAGSMESLRRWFSSVERLPDSWPLARLSITLDGLTSQLSKVVMTATMEIIASCRYPDYGLPSVTQLAKDVTIALALHLADLVANWLCGILDQQAVLLFNESTACMLQASYWVRPIYEELLYSSSHAYQGSTVEAQRASNGLVKVISSKTGSDGDHVPQTSSSCISPLVVLGKSLSASVLQIWFPAHWAVRVETRLSSLGGTTSEYRAEHTQTLVPNVRCNIKLPGQSIDVEHLLQRFPTVLRGIVQGVFRQQAGGAWFPCRDLKLAITVLMPQSSEPHHWFGAVACREGSWPMELPNARPLLRPVTLRTFARLRHLSMSPHLWGTLNPDWRSGYRWLYLETPIVESAQSIERKFLARDNSNLTDKFAKSHARDALWRGFRRAQEEMDRLRGRHLPTIDFNIAAALKRLLAHDRAREVSRAQMLKAHVNMAVWRDRYGRLWRRKLT